MSENNVLVAEVEEKKVVVNCPNCSASLSVKLGNYAYVCPVCSQIFRTRVGERLVKEVGGMDNVSERAEKHVKKCKVSKQRRR